MSKGDERRPTQVPDKQVEKNWARTFGSRDKITPKKPDVRAR